MALQTSTRARAHLLIAAFWLAAGSCADDNVSMRIECSISPEPAGDVCSFDPGGDCIVEGQINLLTRDRYHAVLRVSNSLVPRESENPLRPEPNGAIIRELEIEVLDTAGNTVDFGPLPNPFRIATSGFAPPGTPLAVGGDLLPQQYVTRLRAMERSANMLNQVVLSVVVRGKTPGGEPIESGEWEWPVTLSFINSKDTLACVPFANTICTPGQDNYSAACDPSLADTN